MIDDIYDKYSIYVAGIERQYVSKIVGYHRKIFKSDDVYVLRLASFVFANKHYNDMTSATMLEF